MEWIIGPSMWPHSLAALVGIALGFILVGMPGILAYAWSTPVLCLVYRRDCRLRSLSGDDVWPMIFLIALSWPLGFWIGGLVLTQLVLSDLWIRAAAYASTILLWGLVVSTASFHAFMRKHDGVRKTSRVA